MKIKLFEEYNDPTYWEISRTEYDEFQDIDLDEFNDTEIKIIKRSAYIGAHYF